MVIFGGRYNNAMIFGGYKASLIARWLEQGWIVPFGDFAEEIFIKLFFLIYKSFFLIYTSYSVQWVSEKK